MEYQSPDDQVMVAQLPTRDWRDKQFVPGHGLFVNTIVYSYLRLFDREAEAEQLRGFVSRLRGREEGRSSHVHDGLVVPHKPYFALYSYKVYHSERFDLLGNCLAILTAIASPSRARRWIG